MYDTLDNQTNTKTAEIKGLSLTMTLQRALDETNLVPPKSVVVIDAAVILKKYRPSLKAGCIPLLALSIRASYSDSFMQGAVSVSPVL